jgi:hypothetical protein
MKRPHRSQMRFTLGCWYIVDVYSGQIHRENRMPVSHVGDPATGTGFFVLVRLRSRRGPQKCAARRAQTRQDQRPAASAQSSLGSRVKHDFARKPRSVAPAGIRLDAFSLSEMG